MDSLPLNDAEATALRDWMNNGVVRDSRRHASEILDSTRSWVDPNGYRLSDRIWNTRDLARNAIDRRLREAIAAGEDALVVADELERWLQPGLRPARNANGFIIVDGRPGLQGSPVLSFGPRGQYPGSYSTRRLMRTEISRVGSQETDEIAIELGLLVEWLLSNRHPKRDNCDNHAEGSSPGYPPGVYTVADCPMCPDHPHCLCTKTTYDPRTDEEIIADIRREFGLDHYIDPETGDIQISNRALYPDGIHPSNPNATIGTDGIWNSDSLPILEWEDPWSRVVLPESVQRAIGSDPVLRWSRDKVTKVRADHPRDLPYIDNPTTWMDTAIHIVRETRQGRDSNWQVISSHEDRLIKFVMGTSRESGAIQMITLFSTNRSRVKRQWLRVVGDG